MAKSYTSQTDLVFAALSDPTRRSIIEKLQSGDSTLLELAEDYNVSFQAVAKHLSVLSRAGIINKEKVGRSYNISFNRSAFAESLQWMNNLHNFWHSSFDSLEQFLDNQDK